MISITYHDGTRDVRGVHDAHDAHDVHRDGRGVRGARNDAVLESETSCWNLFNFRISANYRSDESKVDGDAHSDDVHDVHDHDDHHDVHNDARGAHGDHGDHGVRNGVVLKLIFVILGVLDCHLQSLYSNVDYSTLIRWAFLMKQF